RSVDEVADAVRFASAHPQVPLGVRSGGHGVSGRSTNDGGIVIDVGALNAIEVLDAQRRLVRIGPGARWQDVAIALAEHGWGITSGDYGGVGVGGLATAGGLGFLAREHGLTIDHVAAAELVLADGSVVRASADEHPELYWGVRGAGGQFGVVTSFDFLADEVGDVGWVQLAFDASDPATLLQAYGAWQEAAPRDTTAFLALTGGTARLYGVVDSDDPDTIVARVQPLADAAPLLDQALQLAPYAAVMANASDEPHRGRGEPVSRSALIEHITPEFAQAAAELIASGAVHWFQLRAVGGAVADVPPDATAYPHRSANFSVVAMGSNPAALDAAFDRLRGHFSGMYLSFDTDARPERIADAWTPAALERLRALKADVDPRNRFSDNASVSGPLALAT
ncbi:MAG TPA: FAD-dependent oxidoreductase, partial [Rhodoglobus sp.]|nr:FAD-dependent oxidoreductase [Rhodoglobus sp.]